MKITGVETIVPELDLNRRFTFVQVHTDDGIIGLGQTVDIRTVGVIHDLAERFLLGRDPLKIKAIWHEIFDWVAFHGYAGAESRALSGIDIALWDVAGQTYGRPIVDLLGGSMRESVPIYNTCGTFGEFSDGRRSGQDPVGLARELLDEGISCMKWAPFDRYAKASHGQRITASEIAEGLTGIEKVASEFGDRMQIMIEAHGLWTAGCAAQIANALEGLPVPWIEDPIAQDNFGEWAWLRAKSPIPIAGGERLLTRHQMRRLIETGGVDVIISDVTWAGGITECVRIAEFADLFGVSFATHGNSGPVNLWSAAHVLSAVPNAYALETVRVYHDPVNGYYHTVADGPQILNGGVVHAPVAPGLGIRMRDDFVVSDRRLTGVGSPGNRAASTTG